MYRVGGGWRREWSVQKDARWSVLSGWKVECMEWVEDGVYGVDGRWSICSRWSVQNGLKLDCEVGVYRMD